ncbi:MAG: PD-(D/E)XK nuclease family protein [Candidatus Woesearchaeota archaeon]
MKTYSNSKLSSFEQCPLKYKFHYIDELETEIKETVEAFLGSRVHEVLHKLYKDLRFEKLNSLPELLEYYNSEWKKNWNDSIMVVRDEYDQENYRRMGERFITDYYNRHHPFNSSRTVGLETQDFVDIHGYSVHVRIDRLAIAEDGVYEIHDYKTSNSLPKQDKLDSDRQLAVYSYGVKKMYPDAKNVRLVWHFLAFDKELTSVRTDDQLEQLKSDVLKVIKQIESCKEFPAKESGLCEWCEFRQNCPNFKHLYEIETKPSEEFLADDGVRLVNEYAALKTNIDEKSEELEFVREKLVRFAKSKGMDVVYGSDLKASVKSYPKLSFPKKEDFNREEFLDMIRKLGLWDSLATVDTYELAKMLNRGEITGELRALLDRFIEKGEIVRINLRKK